MTWKPSDAQLSILAKLWRARASRGEMAKAMGIGEAEFSAWADRVIDALAVVFSEIAGGKLEKDRVDT